MIMLDLLPQVEQIIQQKAQAQGVTKETLAKNVLYQQFLPNEYKQETAFDLKQMQQAVDAPNVTVPDFDTDEDFLNWVKNLSKIIKS